MNITYYKLFLFVTIFTMGNVIDVCRLIIVVISSAIKDWLVFNL